jgi:hypothetical protein
VGRPRGGGPPPPPRDPDIDPWDALYADVITLTGWTWDYIDAHMTFPRLRALNARWRDVPPPAMQLARIAAALGLKPAPRPQKQTAQEFMQSALAAGVPVIEGRPDDPMLAFLDD